MKKILLAVLVIITFFGCSKQAAVGSDNTALIIATSGEPVRFFSCGPDGSNGNDLIVLNNVYDSLVTLEADGSIRPALAESWSVSDNGLEYTFKLRKGVKFHDGSEMTASDVVYTFDLCSKNSTGRALIINYASAEVIDPYTAVVKLTEPYAPFINGVASRAAYIISKAHHEKVDSAGYLKEPIGTGAYKFVSSVSGDKVVLEAFEDYWNGAPAIKTVTIKIMTDTTTQIIALENNDIDAILSPSLSSCLNLKAPNVSWLSAPSAGRVTLLISENKNQPGSDKNFRKAVQAAVNKDEIIQGAMEGYATQIEIDMCPAYTGHPAGYTVVNNDIELAKNYLAQSKTKSNEFSVLVQSGSTYESVAQILQAQLMKVGIKCTINAVDNATFNDLWYAGNFGGMIRVTNSSLNDADGLANFFMAVNYPQTNNNQFLRTKEIYDLCMKARTVQGEERASLYLQAVNIITEEAYQVPVYANTNTLAFNKNLTGVEVHPLNLLFFHRWKRS